MAMLRNSMCVVAALAVLLAAAPDETAAQTGDGASSDEFVLRTYEVGDLVVKVPDYAGGAPASVTVPASGGRGGFGGGGGGFFNVADQGGGGTAGGGMGGGGMGGGGSPYGGGSGVSFTGAAEDPMQITFDTLIDAIVTVVAPATWTENGGGDGAVSVVGAALVVWQTPDVHDRISNFLEQLRQGSATRRTVTVDARWLLLTSDDLVALHQGGTAIVREALEEFTRRPDSLRGITNCFSGQSVYLISGTRRDVVRSYIPVVGSVDRSDRQMMLTGGYDDFTRMQLIFAAEEGGEYADQYGNAMYGGGRGVGYQPVVETPNFGASLRIRPTVMQGDEAVVVDLTSTITFPGKDDGKFDMASGWSPAPRPDRLAIDTQELATTLRVPLGKPVLVGGMSHIAPAAGSAGGDVAAASETPQLYMVLEVR